MTDPLELSKAKILIVENEAIIAAALEVKLKEMGYIVSGQVFTAEEALEMIEQEPPDLILMDIRFQGKMDGIEAAAVIRDRWEIPVVFTTAYADRERIKRAMPAYPFGYLIKPYQEQQIQATIEMALYVARIDRKRRKAEEALKKSEEEYRLLVDQAVDGIFVLDAEGNFVFVNEAICKMLGYNREELLGRGIFDTYRETEREIGRQRLAIIPSGESISFERDMVRKDGSTVSVSASAVKLADSRMQAIVRDITDRKRTEEILVTSEAQLSNALQLAQAGHWEYDVLNDMFTFNDNFYRIYRTTAEEVGGYRMSSSEYASRFCHPDDAVLVAKEVRAAIETTDPAFNRQIEHRIRYADGKVGYIAVRFFIFKDQQGRTIKTFGVNQDITERKKAEEALIESESRFRTIIEESVAGYFRIGLDGCFEYVNNAWLQMHGYSSSEEIIGKHFRLTQVDQDLLSAQRIVEKLLRGEPIPTGEFSRKCKDGSIGFHSFSASPVVQNGQVVSLEGFLIDITDRKRADEVLQQTSLKMKNILESISDAFFSMDNHLIVTFFNPAAERLLNREESEILGKYLFDAFPEAQGSIFDEKYHQAVKEKEFLSFETYFDVEPYRNWYDVRVYPQTEGISVYFQVVTDRKQAEDEIRRLNAELEQRVRDRTAELEAANQELEGFSYSISHDLRAPLRHLTGFSKMLAREMGEGLNEKSRHYLEVISDSAVKMGRLVDDILSFSRMGRVEMSRTRLNLDALVREVLNTFQEDTTGREIAWSISSLPEIYGDSSMMKIVFENLISNALKYSRNNPKTEIEIGHQAGQGDEDIIYIKDNGAGFDMQYGNKLFKLFERLHHVHEFEGTGLGLANIKRIISRHGGRVWAEGAVGQGATFYFSLSKRKEDRLGPCSLKDRWTIHF